MWWKSIGGTTSFGLTSEDVCVIRVNESSHAQPPALLIEERYRGQDSFAWLQNALFETVRTDPVCKVRRSMLLDVGFYGHPPALVIVHSFAPRAHLDVSVQCQSQRIFQLLVEDFALGMERVHLRHCAIGVRGKQHEQTAYRDSHRDFVHIHGEETLGEGPHVETRTHHPRFR